MQISKSMINHGRRFGLNRSVLRVWVEPGWAWARDWAIRCGLMRLGYGPREGGSAVDGVTGLDRLWDIGLEVQGLGLKEKRIFGPTQNQNWSG